MELNLRDRALGEVESNSSIALLGKCLCSRFLPLKTVLPKLGGFGKEFYSSGSISIDKIKGCVACPSLIWSQVNS